MKKKKIIILTLLACLGIAGFAQETDKSITGIVVDKWGNPVYGASVLVVGAPMSRVETGKDGTFEIVADKSQKLRVFSADKGEQTVDVKPGKPMTIDRKSVV